MSGATPLVPILRRSATPTHLFFPPFAPEVPKEPKFSPEDPFFLPQVQTQTSLLRSEPLGTVFVVPQFQSDSFFIRDQLATTSSNVVESVQVQTLSGETQLDEEDSCFYSTENAFYKELHADVLLEASLLESVETRKFEESEIVAAEPSSQCQSLYYNQEMTYFAEMDNIDEVLRLFSKMKDSNCEINVLCYNTVINALVISDRAKDAQDLFDEMLQSGVTPNISSFNILVKLHSWLSKKFDLVYEVMAKMKEFGFTPDVVTYDTVITGLCKEGRLEEAWGLLDFMIEEKCAPTVCTYTPIVEGYCLQGKIEEAKHLMATMESLGCTPNTVTYNILIRALCTAGRFDDVEKILEESQTKGWIPNTVTYNTYMDDLCKNNMPQQAIEKLQIMIDKGLEPIIGTVSILINCLCSDSNFLAAHNLLKEGQFFNYSIRACDYNTFMSRLSEIGRWWLVLKLLTDMFKKGIDPNVRTCSIVVHSLCRGDKFNIAKVLFTCRGFVRNIVSYNILLHWSFRSGRSKEVATLLSDMAMKQIGPSEITYGIIVDGLCRERKYAEASGFFLESLAAGLAGGCISGFVNSLVMNRKLKEILHVFKKMQEQGFSLDAFVFDLTIRAFCRHGFCVSSDIFTQCLVLDKMLEKVYEVDKGEQNFG